MEVSQARLPLALHIEHSALPMVIIRVCLFSLWAFLVTFLVDFKVVDASRLSHLGTAMTGILSMGESTWSSLWMDLGGEESKEGKEKKTFKLIPSSIWVCRLGFSRWIDGQLQE